MPAFQNKTVTYFYERIVMNPALMTPAECRELRKDTSEQEYDFYLHIRESIIKHPPAFKLKNKELAQQLGWTENAVAKVKSNLKKKGYLVITFSKNADGDITAEVYIGKKQVMLYNLGLRYQITDSALCNELLEKFPILDPTLSLAQRELLIEQANEYARNSIQKRK